MFAANAKYQDRPKVVTYYLLGTPITGVLLPSAPARHAAARISASSHVLPRLYPPAVPLCSNTRDGKSIPDDSRDTETEDNFVGALAKREE